MADKLEKEADESIKGWVDDGYSLGEIFTICTKVLKKIE